MMYVCLLASYVAKSVLLSDFVSYVTGSILLSYPLLTVLLAVFCCITLY